MDGRWMVRFKLGCAAVGLWSCCALWAPTPENDPAFHFRPLRLQTQLRRAVEFPAAALLSLSQVFSFYGEKIYRYQQNYRGIPIEDGGRLKFLRRGFKPLQWVKNKIFITSQPEHFSYEQAAELAKAWVKFQAGVDQDVSGLQEDVLTYGFDPATRTHHLLYHYWFEVKALEDFVHVKVDAHTGEVVAAYLNRYYDQEFNLGAEMLEPHPIRRTLEIPVGDLSAVLSGGEGQQAGRVDSEGRLVLGDDVTQARLVFENKDIHAILNRSPAQLPQVSTYQYNFAVDELSKTQSHLESVIPMSILMAFTSLTSVKQQADAWMGSEKMQAPSLPVIVDYATAGGCNAYFSPGLKQTRPPHLVFYAREQGRCRAAAQNNSVLLHEWGHYLDHLTAGITDAATSEGIGDVISMLYTRQPLIAPDFLENTPQSYIRDLRVDREYPLHKGQIHFEGQILGSTMWDLITLWRGIYGDDTVFSRLQAAFLKSLMMASHQLDFHEVIIALLDETPDDPTWSHLQCSANEVFSQHGLASREKKCLKDQPTLAILLETPASGFFASGDTLSPTVRITPAALGVAQEGILAVSLWQDDMVLSKTQTAVLVGPDATPVEQGFDIALPPTVSTRHRYELRATFTDQKHSWVVQRQALPIDRIFDHSVKYAQKRPTPIRRGWQEIPLKLSGEGFIEGPVQIKLQLDIPDDRERVDLALGSSDGKVFYFSKTPESLKALANRWHNLPYLFQGDAISNIDRLIVVDHEKHPAGLSIEAIELRAETYRSTP